jgi:hypothetical protein
VPPPPPQDPFLSAADASFAAPYLAAPGFAAPDSADPAAAHVADPGGPAAPTRNRRARIIGGLPIWGLVALGAAAVVAGLLVVPSITPWSRAPVESPLDDSEAAVGVIGNQTPAPTSADASPGPDASAEPTPGPDGTGAPGGPGDQGSPDPTDSPTSGPVPSPGLEIASYLVVPLPDNGHQVSLEIANRSTVGQTWHSVSVSTSGWLPSVAVVQPAGRVRAYPGPSRACVAPTDPTTAWIEAGRSLTIGIVIYGGQVFNSVRTVQLNDVSGCTSAES